MYNSISSEDIEWRSRSSEMGVTARSEEMGVSVISSFSQHKRIENMKWILVNIWAVEICSTHADDAKDKRDNMCWTNFHCPNVH
jgi:hypothetical protein